MNPLDAIQAALEPFAELADKAAGYGHESYSTCEWLIKNADLIRAREALSLLPALRKRLGK